MPNGGEKSAATLTLDWVRDNAIVRERALENLRVTEDNIGDSVLEDPEKLVDLFDQLAQEADAENAPAEVVNTLQSQVETLRAGRQNLQQYEYTLVKLKDLKGLTTVEEFETALTDAADQAPDEPNKQRLEHARAAVRAVSEGEPTPAEACPFCCALGCVACNLSCFGCCAIGCIFCELVEP